MAIDLRGQNITSKEDLIDMIKLIEAKASQMVRAVEKMHSDNVILKNKVAFLEKKQPIQINTQHLQEKAVVDVAQEGVSETPLKATSEERIAQMKAATVPGEVGSIEPEAAPQVVVPEIQQVVPEISKAAPKKKKPAAKKKTVKK